MTKENSLGDRSAAPDGGGGLPSGIRRPLNLDLLVAAQARELRDYAKTNGYSFTREPEHARWW